jgi:hypothetical protein
VGEDKSESESGEEVTLTVSLRSFSAVLVVRLRGIGDRMMKIDGLSVNENDLIMLDRENSAMNRVL